MLQGKDYYESNPGGVSPSKILQQNSSGHDTFNGRGELHGVPGATHNPWHGNYGHIQPDYGGREVPKKRGA